MGIKLLDNVKEGIIQMIPKIYIISFDSLGNLLLWVENSYRYKIFIGYVFNYIGSFKELELGG